MKARTAEHTAVISRPSCRHRGLVLLWGEAVCRGQGLPQLSQSKEVWGKAELAAAGAGGTSSGGGPSLSCAGGWGRSSSGSRAERAAGWCYPLQLPQGHLPAARQQELKSGARFLFRAQSSTPRLHSRTSILEIIWRDAGGQNPQHGGEGGLWMVCFNASHIHTDSPSQARSS